MTKLICLLALTVLFAKTSYSKNDDTPIKKHAAAVDQIASLDGNFKVDSMGEMVVVYLPKNQGRFCISWIKIGDTLPAGQRDRNAPKDWATYRNIVCEAPGGRCPEPVACAQENKRIPYFNEKLNKQLDKVYWYEPSYVPLKSQNLKYVENWKGGRTVEFNKDVRLESRNEKYKYLPEKHVSLFEKFPPPDGTFNFCTMPVKITGENAGLDKIPDTVACVAVIDDEGKLTCPDLPTCVQKRLRWKLPLAQIGGKPTNTELALDPHAPSKADPKGKAAPTQTHF